MTHWAKHRPQHENSTDDNERAWRIHCDCQAQERRQAEARRERLRKAVDQIGSSLRERGEEFLQSAAPVCLLGWPVCAEEGCGKALA